MIIVTNVKSIVVFVLSSPVSEILQVFLLKQHPTPIPREIWGCSLCTRLLTLELRGVKILS